MQVPLILFSGGLDSTYLLWQRLLLGPVDTLYVEGGQHPLKIQAERQAQERILKKLETLVPYRVRKRYQASVTSFATMPDAALCQFAPWIMGALLHVHPHEHSEVAIAYVMNDDAVRFRTEMLQAWKGLMAVSRHNFIPLAFPMDCLKKSKLLEYLPSELLEDIWACETPIAKGKRKVPQLLACGYCPACRRSAWEKSELVRSTPVLEITDSPKRKKARPRNT